MKNGVSQIKWARTDLEMRGGSSGAGGGGGVGVAAPLRDHPLSKVHASHIYTPLADALCALDAHALVNDQDVHQK